jgi:dTMP kinase
MYDPARTNVVSALPGFFLVIEGIDGAGKSTLAKHLAAWATARGERVTLSREPTDGPWGARIRSSAATGRMTLRDELECFVRDRQEHVLTLIRPALLRGDFVLLDRYYYSTAAYQGARGASVEAVLRLNRAFAPKPDLVLLLDYDLANAPQRFVERGAEADAFEGAEYLGKVRRIFDSIAQATPEMQRVDANADFPAVLAQCTVILDEALAKKRSARAAEKA